MGKAVELWIAKDYSAYPSGRDDVDGPNNGKRFRDDFLLPRLREAMDASVPLIVHLDDVLSFGSSFLEEAFGGLVRIHRVSKKDIKKTLQISEGWPGNIRYKEAIIRYIAEA